MTPAVRHGLQAMLIGCGLAVVATAWIVVLAFVDQAAIVGWPLVLLGGGLALVLGGVVSVEIYVRRRP